MSRERGTAVGYSTPAAEPIIELFHPKVARLLMTFFPQLDRALFVREGTDIDGTRVIATDARR